MNRRTFLRNSAVGILMALVPPASWLEADNGESTVQGPATRQEERLLARSSIVPLSVVNRYFSEITTQASTGPDLTALGNPAATRAVIYASSDGAQRVTLTVDWYPTAADASSAFQQAVRGSENAPGFNLLPAPDLGEQAYAGTSTNGEELHVGLGARDGELIVAATIAGYDATPAEIAKLVALAREETDAARAALGTVGSS